MNLFDTIAQNVAMSRADRRFFVRLPWRKLVIWAVFLTFIYVLSDFFDILFLTFIFSYFIKSAVTFLMTYSNPSLALQGRYRKLFTIILFLIFIGSIGLLVTLALPHFYEQANNFIARVNAIHLRSDLESALRRMLGTDEFAQLQSSGWYRAQMEDWTSTSTEMIPRMTQQATKALLGILTGIFHFFLSMIFSFLIVLDIPKFKRGFEYLEKGNAREFYKEIVPTLTTFGGMIGRAFQAQAVIAVCNTILTFMGLLTLQVPSALFLSSIVFFFSFIPVVGVFISTVPIALVALDAGGIDLVLQVLILIVGIHTIETYFLNPKIVGNVMHMHPLIVLIVLLIAEHYFRIWGLLLGVPVSLYFYNYIILGEEHLIKKS